MAQKPIQCCSKTPVYLVTYSVSGSEKNYLVCLSCIGIECFSKCIIRQRLVENKKNFLQNEPSELTDESYDISESYDEQTAQNEQDHEHSGGATK